MLAIIALIASASALDVWSGSNNAVSSGSADTAGTMSLFNDAGNVLQGGYIAVANVYTGGTGIAVVDWEAPVTTIQRTKVGPVATHDLTITYGGHLQAGIEKTSEFGAGSAVATLQTQTSSGPMDTGSAAISSNLWMDGKTSGYAIADGVAGFTAARKVDGSTNDLYKVTGAVAGKTDMRGESNAAKDNNDNTADLSSMNGFSGIDTYASAGQVASATTYSGVYTNMWTTGIAQGTSTVTNAQANSRAWDQSSSTIKSDANVNAQTEIADVNMNSVVKGYAQTAKPADPDIADRTYASSDISLWSNPGWAQSHIGTSAQALRLQANTNIVTAESFINGGSYKSVNRQNELNVVEAKGALGGVFNGLGSGAHLLSIVPAGANSNMNLWQTASLGGVRTDANFQLNTFAPGFTFKKGDDAGSYFGTTGYSTTSMTSTPAPSTPTTLSTSVGNSWEVNWISGYDVTGNMYEGGFGVTSVGPYTSNVNGGSTVGDPRTNFATKQFTQP